MTCFVDLSFRNTIAGVIHMMLILNTCSYSSRTGRGRCRLSSTLLYNRERCDVINCVPIRNSHSCFCKCFTKIVTDMIVWWTCDLVVEPRCSLHFRLPLLSEETAKDNQILDSFKTNIHNDKKQTYGAKNRRYVRNTKDSNEDTHRSNTHVTSGVVGTSVLHNYKSPPRSKEQFLSSKPFSIRTEYIRKTRTATDKPNVWKTSTRNEGIDKTDYKLLTTVESPTMKLNTNNARPRSNAKAKKIQDTSPVPAWAIAIIVLFVVIILVLAVLIIY